MIYYITKDDYISKSDQIKVTNVLNIYDLLSGDLFALDIETTGFCPFKDKILLVSISDGKDAIIIDTSTIALNHDFFNKKDFILHNAKFDYKFFANNGIKINIAWDTMLAEQRIIQGSGHKASLKDTLARRLKIGLNKEVRESFKKGVIIEDRHILYSAKDVLHLHNLMHEQQNYIQKFNLQRTVNTEIALVPILADTELFGLTIDEKQWRDNIDRNKLKLKEITKELDFILINDFSVKLKERKQYLLTTFSLFGLPSVQEYESDIFNYNSTKQLVQLAKDLKLPIPRTNEDKDSFSTKAIIDFVNKKVYSANYNKFLRKLVEYRACGKRLNSFGEKFITYEYEGGYKNTVTNKVHTTFRQSTTRNNRLASGNTKQGHINIQQIPRELEYRKSFISDRTGNKILTIDLSGAELIILASLSGDKYLLGNCKKDIHSEIATMIWKKLTKDSDYIVSKTINKDKRQAFKNVIYAWLYGAQSNTIARLLDVSVTDAEIAIKVIENVLVTASTFLRHVANQAIDNGYTIFNKVTNSRSWFVNTPDHEIRRNAMNYIISGTQADIIKEAIVKIDNKIKEKNIEAQLLMQVHDELVYEFNPEFNEFPELVREQLKEMSKDILGNIEIDSEYHVENYWFK